MGGTPIIKDSNQQSFMVQPGTGPVDRDIRIFLDGAADIWEEHPLFNLFDAELVIVLINPLDAPPYEHQAKIPSKSRDVSIKTYLQSLYNAIFQFPPYATDHQNPNRLFAWGEGVVGHGGQRGQDASAFARKIFLPIGLSLPRHSWDQVKQGQKTNPMHISKDPDNYFDDMVRFAYPGVFASFGVGNIMACLGSVTVEQLAELDQDAADDAKKTGGISSDGKIPLVVASPVGFKQPDGSWDITPKTAIYPLTKKGPYSSWINETRTQISFFSFFTKLRLSAF